MTERQLPYLNVGCGRRYHPAWVNIDMVARGPGVLEYDLSKGLPFPDQSFEAVYHSHVLEHISPEHVPGFMKECLRVLKPNGILRMAFPDLEQVARAYLQALENAEQSDDSFNRSAHQWMQTELLDQMVRQVSGGQMKSFLSSIKDDRLKAFVIQRCGLEVAEIIEAAQGQAKSFADKWQSFQSLSFSAKMHFIWNTLSDFFIGKIWLHGEARRAWQIGKFRLSGEVHQWMYDRVSIRQMLLEAGFSDIQVKTAFESDIAHWPSFQLDTEIGVVYKPESLFIEAKRVL